MQAVFTEEVGPGVRDLELGACVLFILRFEEVDDLVLLVELVLQILFSVHGLV